MCLFTTVDLGYGVYNYGFEYWYYSTAIYSLLEGFLSKVEVDSPRYFDTDDIYSYTIRYADPVECRSIVDSDDSVEDRERRMMAYAIKSKLAYRMYTTKLE